MNGRDKIMLTGVAALLLALGAAATLFDKDQDQAEPEAIQPTGQGYVDPSKPFSEGTKRLIDKAVPVEEIPQEFKEAENYLESRWGHLGDSGLMAPGIMPEGDQYFQERRLITGVRGNGKPIFAKAFIRPEKFTGPGVKSGHTQGVEMPFRASSPELSAAQMKNNVQKFKNKGGSFAKQTKGKNKAPKKFKTLDNQPGAGYAPRGGGAGGAADGNN